MLELIIFIIIIAAVSSKNKQKKKTSRNPGQPAPPIFKRSPFPEKAARKHPQNPAPSEPKSAPARTASFQPERTSRKPRIAGERHEEWSPVPEGKQIVCCHYCAAANQIPKHADPSQYTCYFCREDL